MELIFIEARDLPDAWFQCVYQILEKGRTYRIDRGSFSGQERLEFDYITVHIKFPGTRPLLPDIPPALGIPNPVANLNDVVQRIVLNKLSNYVIISTSRDCP